MATNIKKRIGKCQVWDHKEKRRGPRRIVELNECIGDGVWSVDVCLPCLKRHGWKEGQTI